MHFEGDLSSAILSDKDPSDSRYKINKFTYYKNDNSICGDTSEYINGTSLPSFISVGCNKPHSIEYEMISVSYTHLTLPTKA